jgi:hypothetical protein
VRGTRQACAQWWWLLSQVCGQEALLPGDHLAQNEEEEQSAGKRQKLKY